MTVAVTFVVNAEAGDDQTVCVVGDDERIGSWNPQRAVRMEKDLSEEKRWICSVDLKDKTDYSYRFFVGKSRKCKTEDVSNDELIVVMWETHLRPRQFSSGCQATLELPEAHFGLHGVIDTRTEPLHEEDGFEEQLKPGHTTDVFVSNLSNEDCKPILQDPSGMVYSKDDFIIFRARSADTNLMGFQFDIYHHGINRLPYLIGSAHLLPLLQNKSKFIQTLPIIGVNAKPVGAITVDILVVRCVPDVKLVMGANFMNYWNRGQWGQKALDIGHRGLGESYTLLNYKRENTLGSFREAAEHGADCVEFDVVMTRDLYPVIYHDFTVKIACANEKTSVAEHEIHEIPVKDLTLRQLQSLKTVMVEGMDYNSEITDELVTDNHSIAFPTLAKCLKEADDRLSFNIEIKYPQMLSTGISESENFFDPNFYIDQILKVVFDNAGERKIVFSSFDPDMCCMVNLKQNKYPVMFLTQGESHIYTAYMDYRCTTFANAINFAIAEQILGVVLHAEVMLRDMDVIQRVQDKKLTLFVWGADNNDPHLIRRLRDCKVDGIIYDRIDCHKPEHQFKFMATDQSIQTQESGSDGNGMDI